jgi:hypothetical protein
MDVQTTIVTFIIAAAIAFAGITFTRKTRSFSKKKNCGSDCGCGNQ